MSLSESHQWTLNEMPLIVLLWSDPLVVTMTDCPSVFLSSICIKCMSGSNTRIKSHSKVLAVKRLAVTFVANLLMLVQDMSAVS